MAAKDSCFALNKTHQQSIAVRQDKDSKALCSLPFTAEAGAKQPFKRQVHSINVVTVGWGPSRHVVERGGGGETVVLLCL